MKATITAALTCYAIFCLLLVAGFYTENLRYFKQPQIQYVLSEEPDTFDAFLEKSQKAKR